MYIQTKSANAMARNMARGSANELLDDASRAVGACIRALDFLAMGGAKADDLALLRATMLDTLSNMQAGIDKLLDDQGEVTDQHQIDVSELETA